MNDLIPILRSIGLGSRNSATKAKRDRHHVYIYTVKVKSKEIQIEACNMLQVATKLGVMSDSVTYISKVILS